VSAAWENANINDDPVILSNVFGTMAYADAGPDTRTTQIFVNLGDNSGLDAQGFSPFGTISSTDMGVFSKIYAGYGQDPDQDLIYSQVCVLLVDDWVGRVMYWEMSMGPPPTRCRSTVVLIVVTRATSTCRPTSPSSPTPPPLQLWRDCSP
jgi:cyclophilin family peptidyl-prolyl cis-trans isomerase